VSEEPARDTTFDGVMPERVWLNYNNGKHNGPYFRFKLEINGIEKELNAFYIPGIDQNEGLLCGSHNLTWILEPLKTAYTALEQECAELRATNAQLKETATQLQAVLADNPAGECIFKLQAELDAEKERAEKYQSKYDDCVVLGNSLANERDHARAEAEIRTMMYDTVAKERDRLRAALKKIAALDESEWVSKGGKIAREALEFAQLDVKVAKRLS
jgi:hypothetical protein